MTLKQHLEQSHEAIEREAVDYAKAYGVSMEVARRDITDMYKEGYFEALDESRYV